MPPTQKNRLLAIGTALGDDALVIKKFVCSEQLGRLFQMDVELLSDDVALDFDSMVGTNASVRLSLPSGETRYFNGFVSRFVQVGSEGKFGCYHARLVPWLWFLTRTADCRIFQKKTVPDILEDVFKTHGFKDYTLKLSASYRTWEYCVQYRETDFNFVSRLMEQEGIYYYFEHADGTHTLVLADGPSAHSPFPGYDELVYRAPTRSQEEMGETISDWVIEKEVQTGIYALADFNFQTTVAPMISNADIARSHPSASFEIFDYPGEFTSRNEGDAYAKLRIQELQAQHETLRAQCNVRGVSVGSKFKLKDHPREDQNGREYLITSATCHASVGSFESGGDGESFYSCNFTSIPATEFFRSPRTTPKPTVQGPQTAIIVGKKGEEIDTDEFGRVRVQFHWDRYGKVDENSSCWLRVSQPAAGKAWGAISIPRIGQEVLVEFLEGDPDRPIITGRVYNAKNTVPYALPANKTLSTFKSSSSKGGAGFNEIRFEDKKGEEQIFVHGEKNQDIRIKNDIYEWVGNDRHLVVKHDQLELVENDRQEKVARDVVQEIGRDHHLTIKGKEAIKITGSHSITVEDDVIEVFKKNQSTQVTKNLYVKGENIVIEATKNITINVGDSYIAIESGGIKIGTQGEIVLEAMKSISVKATQDVKIEATMNATMKGTAGLKAESPAMAEVSTSGILTLKGSLTMIN